MTVTFSTAIICWHFYRPYVRLLQICFYHHHTIFLKCTKLPIRIPVYYPIDLLLKKKEIWFPFCFSMYVHHMTNHSIVLLLLTKANLFSSIWSKNSKCQNRCWLMLTSRYAQKHHVTEVIILLSVCSNLFSCCFTLHRLLLDIAKVLSRRWSDDLNRISYSTYEINTKKNKNNNDKIERAWDANRERNISFDVIHKYICWLLCRSLFTISVIWCKEILNFDAMQCNVMRLPLFILVS